MSSQMKKRFEELAAYLGRDTKGLELLKKAKDAANELRKNLAAAEDRVLQMEAVKDAARDRADVAEVENARLHLENAALLHKAAAAERREAMAMQRVVQVEAYAEDANPKIDASANRDAQFVTVLGTLMKRVPQYPYPVGTETLAGKVTGVYDMTAFAGLSEKDLWTVGAMVAVLLSVAGQVVLTTKEKHWDTQPTHTTPRLTLLISEWMNTVMQGVDIFDHVRADIKQHKANR